MMAATLWMEKQLNKAYQEGAKAMREKGPCICYRPTCDIRCLCWHHVAPKPSPAVEEGPAGGEAGEETREEKHRLDSMFERANAIACECDEENEDLTGLMEKYKAAERLSHHQFMRVRDAAMRYLKQEDQLGYQRGLEAGAEPGRRITQAALDAAADLRGQVDKITRLVADLRVEAGTDPTDIKGRLLHAIRALPLSVADGPAPATEKHEAIFTGGYHSSGSDNEGRPLRNGGPVRECSCGGDWPCKKAAPSPPTAEEGVWLAERDAAIERINALESERAALLTCLQELRLVAWQAFHALTDIHKYGEHKDNPLPVRLRKALAAADAVVKQ